MRDPQANPIPPTDDELIRRFLREGDSRSFGLLVERHRSSVRRLLWVMLGGAREEIEDAEQEVLLALYRGLASFRFQSSFRTYLLSLARHRALDALRRLGRRRREEQTLRLLAPSAADPQERVQERLLAEQVLAGFRLLPVAERELLLLRDVEGLSMRELASTLGLPSGTAKSKLHRARIRLARILGEGK